MLTLEPSGSRVSIRGLDLLNSFPLELEIRLNSTKSFSCEWKTRLVLHGPSFLCTTHTGLSIPFTIISSRCWSCRRGVNFPTPQSMFVTSSTRLSLFFDFGRYLLTNLLTISFFPSSSEESNLRRGNLS